MASLTFLHCRSSLPTIGIPSHRGVGPEGEVPPCTRPSAAGTAGVSQWCLPFAAGGLFLRQPRGCYPGIKSSCFRSKLNLKQFEESSKWARKPSLMHIRLWQEYYRFGSVPYFVSATLCFAEEQLNFKRHKTLMISAQFERSPQTQADSKPTP